MAKLKMELVGLDQFFTLPGAFGDESHNRRDLPATAAERIRKHLQLDLAPEQFIVIGDTPNDIDCARHFGARAVAVGTGRVTLREEIVACKPDALAARISRMSGWFWRRWKLKESAGSSQSPLRKFWLKSGGSP